MTYQQFPVDAGAATAPVNPSVFAQGIPPTIEALHVDAQSLARGYRASKMIGRTVVNGAGEIMGTIHDFVVGSDKEVPYAVLLVGGFMGMGKREVYAPFTRLEFSDAHMVFRAATKVMLKNLPELSATNGHRISTIVGATVVNAADEPVGTVDDLMITPDQNVQVAVLSVGGFLGMGKKHVVVPCGALDVHDGQVVLALATKDSLKGLPEFNYSD